MYLHVIMGQMHVRLTCGQLNYISVLYVLFLSVVLGNAYLSLFFMSNQDPQILKQCTSAYSQAVSTRTI